MIHCNVTMITHMMTTDTKDLKIIFVTGASRSGTTLMNHVLGNHTAVLALHETHYFGEACNPSSRGTPFQGPQLERAAAMLYGHLERGIFSGPPTVSDIDKAKAFISSLPAGPHTGEELYAGIVGGFVAASGRQIACEQTPRNIFYARQLLDTYPNAYVVHMLRDPRAVMASQKKRWQRRKLARFKVPLYQTIRVWINYHPFTTANLWRRATQAAHGLREHPRFHTVRFESLLESPEQTVRQMCEAIGLDFQPAMLDVAQINSSHQTSVGGARRGIYKDAMDTWRSVLSPSELAVTEKIAGPAMIQVGYPLATDGKAPFASFLPHLVSYGFHALGVMLVNPKRAIVQLKALLNRGGR